MAPTFSDLPFELPYTVPLSNSQFVVRSKPMLDCIVQIWGELPIYVPSVLIGEVTIPSAQLIKGLNIPQVYELKRGSEITGSVTLAINFTPAELLEPKFSVRRSSFRRSIEMNYSPITHQGVITSSKSHSIDPINFLSGEENLVPSHPNSDIQPGISLSINLVTSDALTTGKESSLSNPELSTRETEEITNNNKNINPNTLHLSQSSKVNTEDRMGDGWRPSVYPTTERVFKRLGSSLYLPVQDLKTSSPNLL